MNPQTSYDKVLAALTVWRKHAGKSMPARNAVFHVILNRVMQSPKNGWPASVHGVCTQPGQFSSFNANDPGITAWPLEKHPADWNAWLEIQQIIESPLLADPTQGATFYFDDSIAPPFKAWLGANATAEDLEALKTVTIGRLSFYRI